MDNKKSFALVIKHTELIPDLFTKVSNLLSKISFEQSKTDSNEIIMKFDKNSKNDLIQFLKNID